MAAPKKTKPTEQAPDESDGVTLDQALEEEGEGRTTESLSPRSTKVDDPSKMDRAIKIIEEMWDGFQAGKVRRNDVILPSYTTTPSRTSRAAALRLISPSVT